MRNSGHEYKTMSGKTIPANFVIMQILLRQKDCSVFYCYHLTASACIAIVFAH